MAVVEKLLAAGSDKEAKDHVSGDADREGSRGDAQLFVPSCFLFCFLSQRL